MLVFAGLRQLVGNPEVLLPLGPGVTVRGCWEELCGTFPALASHATAVRPALNRAYCGWDEELRPGDELAFIPPVSGGAGPGLPRVRVGPEPIDVAAMQAELDLGGQGAVAVFVGVVRDPDEGREVTHLTYEAYPDMAEAELGRIVAQARAREGVGEVLVHHRTGRVDRGVASVAVVVAAAHRHQALRACTEVIDELKERAPIWKTAG